MTAIVECLNEWNGENIPITNFGLGNLLKKVVYCRRAELQRLRDAGQDIDFKV